MLSSPGQVTEPCLQNTDDPEDPFPFLKVSMILGRHLGKEERKDSSALPLTLMGELSSVLGDSAKSWA